MSPSKTELRAYELGYKQGVKDGERAEAVVEAAKAIENGSGTWAMLWKAIRRYEEGKK